MSNYTILQLNAKELSELKDIATELGLKVSNSAKKETLVYDVLDQQAIVNAQRKTITNEIQETDRKKRLRVPIKKTPEQKLLENQQSTNKPVTNQAKNIVVKKAIESTPIVTKPTEPVAIVAKPVDQTNADEKPAKKTNKPKQHKPSKPALIKPVLETVEKVEDILAVPHPTKVFVLEDRS